MRSILVHGGRDAGMAARLESALAIARATDGHLTLAIDTPIEAYAAIDSTGTTYIARDALAYAIAEDDALAVQFSAQLAREDVPYDVARCDLDPVEALSAGARLADLIVVSRGDLLAGALAVGTRCPVLALPQNRALSFPVECACIAWNGSDEAAIALRSATQLLAGTSQIHVLTVNGRNNGLFPATDAMRYLSRHGLHAELHELPKGDSIEETLAAKVKALGADLMVMGAFGHSRLREFLFGGVTRYFLDEESAPPLLLAH
jgi:nucleotide-binding universal stress UspA family protein